MHTSHEIHIEALQTFVLLCHMQQLTGLRVQCVYERRDRERTVDPRRRIGQDLIFCASLSSAMASETVSETVSCRHLREADSSSSALSSRTMRPLSIKP